MRRRQAHVAADRDHLRDPPERDLQPDLVDDVGDRALEQRDLQIVAMAAQVELLAEPDRAERVDARAIGLAAPQQRQARAAAADLDEQRPGALERRVAAKRVADGEVRRDGSLRPR